MSFFGGRGGEPVRDSDSAKSILNDGINPNLARETASEGVAAEASTTAALLSCPAAQSPSLATLDEDEPVTKE